MLLSGTAALGADIRGTWMIEDEVAVEIADCAGGSLCGRIVWLKTPHDAAGQLKRDLMNPDAALRKHLVCGLTVIEGLTPAGPAKWEAGSFYDPRDGAIQHRDGARVRRCSGRARLSRAADLRQEPDSAPGARSQEGLVLIVGTGYGRHPRVGGAPVSYRMDAPRLNQRSNPRRLL
jgi:hypothetical protein